MGTSTPNYSFYKADPSDPVDVTTNLSENWDRADAHAHSGTYVPVNTVETVYPILALTSTAIQAAIDAAAAAGGGLVTGVLPAGAVYNITSTITMKSRVNVDLRGVWSVQGTLGGSLPNNQLAVWKAANSLNADVVQFPATCHNARLAGVVIDGNKTNQSSGGGIRFVGTGTNPRNGNQLENVFVSSAYGTGILVDSNHLEARLFRVQVMECGSHGVNIQGEDCYLDFVLSGYNAGSGIVVGGSAHSTSMHNIDSYNNTLAGFDFSAVSYLRAVSLQGNNNGQQGMKLNALASSHLAQVYLITNAREFATSAIRYPALLLAGTGGMDAVTFTHCDFESTDGAENYCVQDTQSAPKPIPFTACSFVGSPASGYFSLTRTHPLIACRGTGLSSLVISNDATAVSQTVKGITGQSANLWELRNATDGLVSSFTSGGRQLLGNTDLSARWNVVPSATTQVAAAIQAAASQTADLFVLQNNSAVIGGRFGPTGRYEGALTSYLRSGSYLGPAVDLVTTGSPANQFEYAVPIIFGGSGTLVEIGIETTTNGEAGSLIRLGIRSDDGNGYPLDGAPLVDAGTVAGDGGAAYKSKVISLAVTPGLYWLTATTQVAPTTVPVVRCMNGGLPQIGAVTGATATNWSRNAYRQSGVTGALPSTFSATLDPQGLGPRIVVKVS